jgi:hypothetical protein
MPRVEVSWDSQKNKNAGRLSKILYITGSLSLFSVRQA